MKKRRFEKEMLKEFITGGHRVFGPLERKREAIICDTEEFDIVEFIFEDIEEERFYRVVFNRGKYNYRYKYEPFAEHAGPYIECIEVKETRSEIVTYEIA